MVSGFLYIHRRTAKTLGTNAYRCGFSVGGVNNLSRQNEHRAGLKDVLLLIQEAFLVLLTSGEAQVFKSHGIVYIMLHASVSMLRPVF